MVKQVPGSLDEVLDNLENDHEWLLEGDVFTQDVIDTWIQLQADPRARRRAPAPAPVRVPPLL